MNPWIAVATLAALAAGCSTTATSGLSFYRPKGAEQQHAIGATLKSDTLTVSIDGETAASGAFEGDRANVFGVWHDRRVAADCGRKVDGNQLLAVVSVLAVGYDATSDRYTLCTVYLDGDPAAELQLR